MTDEMAVGVCGLGRMGAAMAERLVSQGRAVVVWNRYRKHGSITRSISNYFRNRAARFEAEAIAEEERARAEAAGETVEVEDVDPDEVAWREHVRRLHEQDPPGGPPSDRSLGR